ncbi:MAG TPA: RodZ domain-containing protein, partial [Candidatus Acidoferrum sp.]
AESAASAQIEDRFDEMAKGTFGERLKRERELREITVAEICAATRIAPKFLEALENEQWEKLPGGVFGRGFVRTIARYLGLSEENLLSDYDLARADTSSAAPTKLEERIPSAPKWLPAIAVLALLAIVAGLVFGGRYAWKTYMAHREAKKASAIVGVPASAESPSPNARSAPSGGESSAALDLSVVTSTPTRVRIVADGTVVHDSEISAGQNLHFSATDKFEVSAASLVTVLLQLNGQPVPLNGAPDSSGTIVLTAKDLRPSTGGPTHP